MMLKVLFLSALLFLFPILVDAQETKVFSVPAPPESRLIDTHDMQLSGVGVSSYLYLSTQNPDKITDYYQDFFSQKEFQTILDEKEKARRLIRFQKDEQVVTVSIRPKEGESQVVIAQYLQPKGKPSPEEAKPSWGELMGLLPKKDQPGEDIKFIPRPPESLRLANFKFGKIKFASYSSIKSTAEIKEFYQGQMYRQGWKLQNEIDMARVVKTMEEKKGSRGPQPIKLPFPDINLQELTRDGYMLYFKGYEGVAQVSIFNNSFSAQHKGSLVLIRYVQE